MRVSQAVHRTTHVLRSVRILNREDRLLTVLGQRIEVVVQVVFQTVSQAVAGYAAGQHLSQDCLRIGELALVNQHLCLQRLGSPHVSTAHLALRLRQVRDSIVDISHYVSRDVLIIVHLRIVSRIGLVDIRNIRAEHADTLEIGQCAEELQLTLTALHRSLGDVGCGQQARQSEVDTLRGVVNPSPLLIEVAVCGQRVIQLDLIHR